jgi:FKBP-type peptidyl-prolyl cis-trans isomerase SlyD
MHGMHHIIPGLESALDGRKAGERLQVTIAPEHAYGESDPELIQAVPRTLFEGVDHIEPGMQFTAQGPDGEAHTVTVREASEEEVVIDGNHPLAGTTLHFDVLVESVREGTPEELDHGHAHGEDDEHD